MNAIYHVAMIEKDLIHEFCKLDMHAAVAIHFSVPLNEEQCMHDNHV